MELLVNCTDCTTDGVETLKRYKSSFPLRLVKRRTLACLLYAQCHNQDVAIVCMYRMYSRMQSMYVVLLLYCIPEV